MPVISFDTHRLITLLTKRGFSTEQAEAIAEALQEVDLSNLVTKDDLRTLKADLHVEIRTLETRMLKWAIPSMLGQIAAFALVVKWMLGSG